MEISSSRLRSRAVGLGIAVQNLFGVLLTTVIPMLNPDEGNLKGKIGFIFAFTTAALIVWTYFRIPEGVLVSWMQCSLRGFLQGDLKCIKDKVMNLKSAIF